MKKALVLSVILTVVSFSATMAQDSIKTKELQEVIVKARRGWFEDGKAVFVPNKNEKNTSYSPETLVEAMRLPVVRKGADGQLVGVNGERVVYFINGVRANETDIKTFWPKQTKRVEYIQDSDDPTFEGCSTVINFIMPRYEAGGVTELQADQTIPGMGSYNVSSKLEYKKSTFGLLLNYNYKRDHALSTESSEYFKDVYINGNLYENIVHNTYMPSVDRENAMRAVASARYKSTKFRADHVASFSWNRQPSTRSSAIDKWTPDLFNSSSSSDTRSSLSATASLTGRYVMQLSDKVTMNGHLLYSYQRSDMNGSSRIGDMLPIDNNSKETANNFTLTLASQIKLSQKLNLRTTVASDNKWFGIDYSGYSSTHTDQRLNEILVSARLSWTATPKLTTSVQMAIDDNYRKWSSQSVNTFRPLGSLLLTYTPSSKIQMYGSMSYHSGSPKASQTSPAVVRESEMIWVQGTPELKNSSTLNPYFAMVMMPSNAFMAQFASSFSHSNNGVMTLYEAAGPEMGGVIKRNVNAPAQNTFQLRAYLLYSFLNNKMSLGADGTWTYDHFCGGRSFNTLNAGFSLSYKFGNCSATINYRTPYTSVLAGGTGKSKRLNELQLQFSWGNGNWHIRAYAFTINHKYSCNTTSFDSASYSSYIRQLARGRGVQLTVSYTFGYGKEMTGDVDLEAPAVMESGVVDAN